MKENLPNFIYIGPNAVPIGLIRGTLYRGSDLPPQIKSLIDTNPKLSSLFVPTERLVLVKHNVKKQGTIENLAATDINNLIRTMKEQRNRK